MLTKLLSFVIALAIFPIKFTCFMHKLMWNYVIDYVTSTFKLLRTS